MRLTKHTDYALRVLLFAASNPDRHVSSEEISAAFGISPHHLVKVVHHLGKLGYVTIRRGRTGGLSLAKPPAEIRLGEVIMATEPDFFAVECFDREHNTCALAPACRLIPPLRGALDAFVAELNRYTLEDVAGSRDRVRYLQLLGERP